MSAILVYFILGIIFYIFIVPIIESLTTLIQNLIELIKAPIGYKITEYNAKIKHLTEGEETSTPRVIGFQLSEEDYEEAEEEDDI